MIILAVDAACKTAGVCIMQDGEVLFEKMLDQGLTHSQTLLPLVQESLQATNLQCNQIDALAVTAGPGSFTGLRIGLALVKGMALPNKTPLVTVSTLEALAVACEQDGIVIPALDARRSEVYWAAFEKEGKSCRRLTEDAAGPVEDIANNVNILGKPVFFVGDGALLCYNMYDAIVSNLAYPEHLPKAAYGAALLAESEVKAGTMQSASLAKPEYLRLSQAERMLAQKQSSSQKGE